VSPRKAGGTQDPFCSDPFAELIGESPAIERVRQALRALVGSAGPRSNVLLAGEAGSGKTLIAGLLARLGCHHAPQVAVNVAALPNDRMLPGLVRAAQGGTIVIEEINQLHPTTQLALLKVIREPGARRQGPPTATSWIISTTNMNPLAALQYGHFRDDLYRRLAAVFIAMHITADTLDRSVHS
jgi:arginine utilization regulatory protein